MRPLIVAIDGPAGAGKSTVSKILARRLHFVLVDTGAIYRCVALKARRIPIRPIQIDDARLGELLAGLNIDFRLEDEGEVNHVLLDGEDVSDAIRTPENSMAASQVSGRPVVRNGLLELQRRLALNAKTGSILEGRDIGTVVFPDADVKVYLHADPTIRARRRYEELFQKGSEKPIVEVLTEQNKRDAEDSNREMAPLKAAGDAVNIDSTFLPLSDVVQQIELMVSQRLAARA